MSEPGCISNSRYDLIKVLDDLTITNDIVLNNVSSNAKNERNVIYEEDITINVLEVEDLVVKNTLNGNHLKINNLPLISSTFMSVPSELDPGTNTSFIIDEDITSYSPRETQIIRIKDLGSGRNFDSRTQIIDVNLLQYDQVKLNTHDVHLIELYYYKIPNTTLDYEYPLVKTQAEALLLRAMFYTASDLGGVFHPPTNDDNPPIMTRVLDGQEYWSSGVLTLNNDTPPPTNWGTFVNKVIWTNAVTQLVGMPIVYGAFNGNRYRPEFEIIIKNIDVDIPLSGRGLISVEIYDIKLVAPDSTALYNQLFL